MEEPWGSAGAGGELPVLLPPAQPGCWGRADGAVGAASGSARRLRASCRRSLWCWQDVGGELPALPPTQPGGWGLAAGD